MFFTDPPVTYFHSTRFASCRGSRDCEARRDRRALPSRGSRGRTVLDDGFAADSVVNAERRAQRCMDGKRRRQQQEVNACMSHATTSNGNMDLVTETVSRAYVNSAGE